MKVKVVNAILSHLSDAQHLMKAGYLEDANTHINFAKLVALNCDDINEDVESSVLDEMFETAKNLK